MSSSEHIMLITGPGHHAKNFFEALQRRAPDSIGICEHYPRFRYVTASGSVRGAFLYDAMRYLIWGVAARWAWLRNDNRHIDVLFDLYDSICAQKIDQQRMLIGWSQVCGNSMHKMKRAGGGNWLEHPMVHVDTWMNIMQTEYDKFGIRDRSSLFSSKMVARMKREYELADKIHVLSSYARATFIQAGVTQEKLMITVPGVDVGLFRPEDKNAMSCEQSFVILFVGRIEILKGVHYLLKAFEKVKKHKVELWLVGNVKDDMKPLLTDLEQVRLVGQVSAEELPGLYSKADVLVLPSIQEAFGLVILEAMACGTPVIASEHTGGPDVIDDGLDGFIVPVRSEEALADRLLWCLENREALHHMGEQAREKVRSRFSLDHYFAAIGEKMGEMFLTK